MVKNGGKSCQYSYLVTCIQNFLTIILEFVISSGKHAALRSKNNDWLSQNQNNVSEWSDMSTGDCCFSELAL